MLTCIFILLLDLDKEKHWYTTHEISVKYIIPWYKMLPSIPPMLINGSMLSKLYANLYIFYSCIGVMINNYVKYSDDYRVYNNFGKL